MLFFNIKNQAFEHSQYIQCSQCHQVAVTAHTQLKFVRFGLIPLFPFALERASYCANCSAKNLPENSKDLNKEMLFIPYIIPMYNSVDIDIEDDFKLAKKLFKNSK